MSLTTTTLESDAPVVGGFYRSRLDYNTVVRIDWVGDRVLGGFATKWVVKWTYLQRTVTGFSNEEPMKMGCYHFDPNDYQRVYPGP